MNNPIDNTTWYIGKDIVANDKLRGRGATAMHYIIAAVQTANEEKLTVEQLKSMIDQANAYIAPAVSKEKSLKALGF